MAAGGYRDPGVTEMSVRTASGAAREADLIARIAEHDRKALEELNDTFYVVWRKARSFRGDSQPSTWLLGIAYRTARNALRSAARNPAGNPPADLLPLTHEGPADSEELRDWLGRALEQLPPEQRLAVELCYELGHSCEEIAVMMGCPVNTVKTRLFHARAKLQKLLPHLADPLAAGGATGAAARRN